MTKPAKPCGGEKPKTFFYELDNYFKEWLMWASEIDACWDATCKSANPKFQQDLEKLCKDIGKWAVDAKKWGDVVEDCFQKE